MNPTTTRIWYQSFVDPVEQRPYIERLQSRLAAYAGPGIEYVVHGISPPDRYLSAITEFRCAAKTIHNAIEAQRQGYAGFVIGHFQEPGLRECRSAVNIPVTGLGEATLLHACTLGRRFGLVTINPVFIPWHREQLRELALEAWSVGVRAVNTQVATYMDAFENEAAYQGVKAAFVEEARPLVEAGAEVLLPAGGLPMLLFTRELGFTVNGAVVLNGIAVVAAMAELAVRLARQTGCAVSRHGTYALAPPEALAEFLGPQ